MLSIWKWDYLLLGVLALFFGYILFLLLRKFVEPRHILYWTKWWAFKFNYLLFVPVFIASAAYVFQHEKWPSVWYTSWVAQLVIFVVLVYVSYSSHKGDSPYIRELLTERFHTFAWWPFMVSMIVVGFLGLVYVYYDTRHISQAMTIALVSLVLVILTFGLDFSKLQNQDPVTENTLYSPPSTRPW